jgi:hypothetical protein
VHGFNTLCSFHDELLPAGKIKTMEVITKNGISNLKINVTALEKLKDLKYYMT